MAEAINSGLPFLAIDPLPGEERRNCNLIEEWGVGYWVRFSQDLATTIARLLTDQNEMDGLRQRALALARPCAAQEAAESILKLRRPATEPAVTWKPELKQKTFYSLFSRKRKPDSAAIS